MLSGALSARSEEALSALAGRWDERLGAASVPLALADVAFTANAGRAHLPYRLALVTASTEDARTQLSAAATTALMLVFVMRLPRLPAAERVGASRGGLWSWAALAIAALLIPWLIFFAVGSPADALDPAKLKKS